MFGFILLALVAVVSLLLLCEGEGAVGAPPIAELRAEAKILGRKMKEILGKAEAEGHELTAEEKAAFDGYNADAKAVVARIAEAEAAEKEMQGRIQAMAAHSKFLNTSQGRKVTPEAPVGDGSVTGTLPEGPVTSGVHNCLEDDPCLGYQSLGAYALDVFANNGIAVNDQMKILAAASGMSQGESASAGFLVPPQFNAQIVDSMAGDSQNLLNMTDQYTVTGDTLTMNAEDETSRADSSRHGGLLGYWLAEAAQATSTKAKFRQLKLEPHELVILTYMTDKLLKNAPALQTYLMRKVPQGITFQVSDAIMNGDGKGKPQGILAGDALVEITKETDQTAATINGYNVAKMYAAMPPRWIPSAVWLYNQEALPELLTLMLVRGTTAVPVFMPAGGYSGLPYNTIFGRPAMPSEYCAALGTAGDLLFVSMGAYMTGTRGTVEQAMSIHLRFDYLETALRWVFSVDGQPIYRSALTPYKGSQTVSPYVAIAARA